MFSVNWSRLVLLLMAVVLRKVRHFDFLRVLTEPFVAIYEEFQEFRALQLYEASLNGQVIYLEKALNDRFDPTLRRIYISGGEYYTPPVFWEEYKNEPVIFNAEGQENPVFWNEDVLGDIVNYNFFVWVPSEIFFNKIAMRAVVDKYKVYGRIYDIKIIQ